LPAPTGSFVEVELRPGTQSDILERKRDKIRPGAVKMDATNDDRIVALYIPDGKRDVLVKILDDYLGAELTEERPNPPNRAKVEAIQAFRRARLETFWTDDPDALPVDPRHEMWWALWCWAGSEATIEDVCARLRVRVASSDRRLYFPEIVVIPVLATRAAIELMLFATGVIAELRRANDSPTFFTDDVRGAEHEWVDSLAERIVWPSSDAPRVCVLDTGVNRAHPLIEPALSSGDLHTLNAGWGVDDQHADGHGTSMAGVALHGDLTAALGDASQRRLIHRLESVKVMPPAGFDPNEPHSYGVLTQAAVARPEISAPNVPRVYCMAVTNLDVSGSTPSSWSAALDQIAAGTMPGEDRDTSPKRLFVVAAGNVTAEVDYTRIQSQDDYPIEDPAQAWNALTVGGYTDLVDVQDEGYEAWLPMVDAGNLSPHSRTSVTWSQDRSPFKPELVFEAGNRIVNLARTEALTVSSLSLLTTGRDVIRAPLVPFHATSAASAQAARMAAQISAAFPAFWPETVRGLMVHSAEWTRPMMTALGVSSSKKAHYELVRRFGYGVPSLERAIASARNDLALFAQAEIQPFRIEGTRKFNECHYYTLPIPRRLLETLENEIIDIKITLLYFVEPNPGLSANVDPQRYQSHGLRFDLRRKSEPLENFKRRVNASERDNPRVAPQAQPDDARWMLGARSVSAGSLHCDVWSGPAIELAGRDTLCIKPVNGWWRQRAGSSVCNRRSRYALIITVKAQNSEIDLYTPISTAVQLPVSIETRV
jgi:hypothetical protein